MQEIRLKDCNKILSCGVAATPEYVDNGIPFISAQNIQNGKLDFSILKYITNDAHKKLIQNKKVKFGDILITRIGAKIGESCIFNLDTEVSVYVSLTHLRLKNSINNNFFTYLIKTHEFYNFVNENTISCGGVGNLNVSLLKNFTFLIPSLQQQKLISSYLDNYTTKIDKEISLLEQKVEKLDEYKQSLIYETVTKGLDKDSPMKDSNIAWIGLIPEHWNIKRVKEFSVWQTGFTPDTKKIEYYEGNDDWITIRDMDGKYINKSKNKINGSLFPKHWITPAKSLLFSFKLSIGQVAFNKTEVFTNEAICSFSSKSKIDLNYFYYAAPIFIVKNAKKNIYDADLLNQDLIANAICVVPPKSEQLEIVNYLDIECTKIDKNKELINKKIELLTEYKQALIYEAVTGKMEIKQ